MTPCMHFFHYLADSDWIWYLFSIFGPFALICTHLYSSMFNIQLAGSWMETLRLHDIVSGVILKETRFTFLFFLWSGNSNICLSYWWYSSFVCDLKPWSVRALYFRRSLLQSVRPRNPKTCIPWIARTWCVRFSHRCFENILNFSFYKRYYKPII